MQILHVLVRIQGLIKQALHNSPAVHETEYRRSFKVESSWSATIHGTVICITMSLVVCQ